MWLVLAPDASCNISAVRYKGIRAAGQLSWPLGLLCAVLGGARTGGALDTQVLTCPFTAFTHGGGSPSPDHREGVGALGEAAGGSAGLLA